MTFETWEAIMRRLVWYRGVLSVRMAEWPEARVDACTDVEELQGLVRLTERVERNEARMDRHMGRGLAALPAPPTGH
jgi:hypothetical protein